MVIEVMDVKKARREYVFAHVIANQIDHNLERTRRIRNKHKASIRQILQETNRLYETNMLNTYRPSVVERLVMFCKSLIASLFPPPQPSSLEILKKVEIHFRRVELPIMLRKELWALMLYHAFHHNDASIYLVGLYRQGAFRKILIEYMFELYDFQNRSNGFAWPMHRYILEEVLTEVDQVSIEYRDFWRYHLYLLKSK